MKIEKTAEIMLAEEKVGIARRRLKDKENDLAALVEEQEAKQMAEMKPRPRRAAAKRK